MWTTGDTTVRAHVEPHMPLLRQPKCATLLYKIMKVGDFVRSVEHRYLHFQRVDAYKDFPSADARDGEQLPLDRASNITTKFERAPHYAAADYFRQALAQEPRSVLAHNSLGTSLARLGRQDEAAREFEAALAIDPSYPPAWRNLARWRGQTQGPDAEIDCLGRAIALDPGFWDARRDLVRVLTSNARYPEALVQLDSLLAHDPRDRSSLWNRALLLGQFLGRPAEALETLNRLESIAGPTDQTRQLRAELQRRG